MAGSLRILILEDNPVDVELIQFELEEAGLDFTANVVAAENDFIRELQEFSPDLILSDYDLPRYNGASALAEARRRCPDTPFILVTGAVGEDRAIEILTQGAKDYVLKTRLEQRLAPAVRRALAEAEERQARRKAEAELREAHRTLEERVKIRTAELEAEIAARKRMEEALWESESRERARAAELQALMDVVPVAVWIAHDPQCLRITGNLCAGEIIHVQSAANVSAGPHPHTAAVAYKVFRGGVEMKPEELPVQVAASTGRPVAAEMLDLVFSDGRKVTMIEGAVPLFDAGGRVRGSVAAGADVTQIRQTEEALRTALAKATEGGNILRKEAEIARLASFPMLNPDPIIEADLAGTIHFCNPAAERLFPDLRQRELVHPLLADWEAIVRSFCEGELKESTRELNIHGRWYRQTIHFVEETKRIHIYGHDITLRKLAEEER